jgi:hypothetical protein
MTEPTKPKRKHVRTGKPGGMPRFVPTAEQRRVVIAMSSLNVPTDFIRWALGSGIKG